MHDCCFVRSTQRTGRRHDCSRTAALVGFAYSLPGLQPQVPQAPAFTIGSLRPKSIFRGTR
jgi:hypothetical protein